MIFWPLHIIVIIVDKHNAVCFKYIYTHTHNGLNNDFGFVSCINFTIRELVLINNLEDYSI